MHRPRHLKLDSHELDGSIRLLSDRISLAEGQTESWETLTRIIRFDDPYYGEVDINRAKLNSMVKNFQANVYGQDIAVDVAHMPSNGAAGFIRELSIENKKLRGRIEWTEFGKEAVTKKGFRYFSAEFHEDYKHPETGIKHGCVLFGAGLTTRPRVKGLDSIDPERLKLSFDDMPGDPPAISPRLIKILKEDMIMLKQKMLKLLSDALAGFSSLGDEMVKQFTAQFDAAMAGIEDEAQAKILLGAFTSTAEATHKLLSEKAETSGTIKLDFSGLGQEFKGGMSKDDILKMLSEQRQTEEADRKKLQEKQTANIKIFTDAINGQEGFSDELKKQLSENVTDLITADMSEGQIKALADNQIAMGNRLASQVQLAGMGFQGAAGSVRITVDDSNTIKSLQETVDRRLGILDMSDSRRYAATGGQLPEENKKFVEKVLAQFDTIHRAELQREHKMLSGGDGVVSDVAVPVSWERTVIREALHRVIGLQFVNVNTETFATSYSIPYSYRDTSAAGRTDTRRFEGQGIPRAGVIQTAETAYNTPQKLAFEVSDELRYLTAARHLNWDAVAENQQNASRIIAEDTEHLIFNEVLNAADEYGAVAVSTEALTAAVDGTDNVFPLANFPVVRPRKVFDLQGNQVGSTTNAITVSYGGSPITEYDGTGTQSAGDYWKMDYNQGEIRIVDEAGALQTPANATALVVSYSYASNRYNFDTDLGTALAEDHWNTFLYRFGLRKALIEDDRYHMANFGLMSGTVANQVEQAKQWAANFRRPGTELAMDGNVGRIKDTPIFKSTAPGLYMGDQRILVGERGITRYRMAKPWNMGELENQKDSNGRYTGKKEAYGDQFVVLHTPTQLKAAMTSIVLYSATGRVARAE